MKPIIIERTVYGDRAKLLIKKIKDYKNYSLYQVYKLEDNNKIPLYKETYTSQQLSDLIKNKTIN